MEINSCFHHCYAALYTSEPHDDKSALGTFFDSLDIPKLDPDLASDLEKDISVEELNLKHTM